MRTRVGTGVSTGVGTCVCVCTRVGTWGGYRREYTGRRVGKGGEGGVLAQWPIIPRNTPPPPANPRWARPQVSRRARLQGPRWTRCRGARPSTTPPGEGSARQPSTPRLRRHVSQRVSYNYSKNSATCLSETGDMSLKDRVNPETCLSEIGDVSPIGARPSTTPPAEGSARQRSTPRLRADKFE